MKKSLQQMSNEELWHLFPIIIKPYNRIWKKRYNIESKRIKKVVGFENIERINHIGSTAVEGLMSKPIIDILLEIKSNTNLQNLIKNLTKSGYIYSSQPNNPPPNMMFMKGYTIKGFKGQCFHLHIRYKGDWDEIVFKNYLNSHSDFAKEYEELKLNLKQKYEFDRDKYTYAKTSFIKKVTKIARDELRGCIDDK
jgi:GrpB-like predicted nucleotidyltransferase (UPF0157 family)